MDNKNVLPPLPASDPQSLQWNRKDNFYDEKSNDFWKKSGQITSHKLEDFKKCDHYFELQKGWFKCQRCHFGLQQSPSHILTISNGKLFYGGQKLEL